MYTKSLIYRILRFISLKIKLDPTIRVADQSKLSKLNLKCIWIGNLQLWSNSVSIVFKNWPSPSRINPWYPSVWIYGFLPYFWLAKLDCLMSPNEFNSVGSKNVKLNINSTWIYSQLRNNKEESRNLAYPKLLIPTWWPSILWETLSIQWSKRWRNNHAPPF